MMNDYLVLTNDEMNSLLKISFMATMMTPYGLLDSVLYGDTSPILKEWFLDSSNGKSSVKQMAFLQFMYQGVNIFKVVNNAKS
ncbi:hypothetical protein G7084_00425 [Weissella coleopterorum]|uniref:Uncharacterized protein n=1 Tax=Weissella coleopterorum TaxID=2714949 RepID=A0A6G8AYG4_9LACO|nr:hypothetical protein [Weissella coleopterorum]QIL49923.1 hypothetical protein G7084_00425 [Weissella coleopterorum]